MLKHCTVRMFPHMAHLKADSLYVSIALAEYKESKLLSELSSKRGQPDKHEMVCASISYLVMTACSGRHAKVSLQHLAPIVLQPA